MSNRGKHGLKEVKVPPYFLFSIIRRASWLIADWTFKCGSRCEAEIKTCPQCGCTTKANFPENVKHVVQYGPHVAALSVYLHHYQLLPYERSCELLSDICGCKISPATLIRAENDCFEKLEAFENKIKNHLVKSDVSVQLP